MDHTSEPSVLLGKVNGLCLEGKIRIWVNEVFIGEVQIQIPPLGHFGYYQNERDQWKFSGWRSFSLWIPAGALSKGEQLITIQQVNSDFSYDTVAIRELKLQLHGSVALPAKKALQTNILP